MTSTGLTRKTVNLIPKANDALTGIIALTGNSATDEINRAIQVHWYLLRQTEAGGEILVKGPDGSLSVVRFL